MKITIDIPDDVVMRINHHLPTMSRHDPDGVSGEPPPLTLKTLVELLVAGADLSIRRPGHYAGQRIAEFLDNQGYSW
jgi:hypothetical protein